MKTYRKKTITRALILVEAVKWDGNSHTANQFLGEEFGIDWHYQVGTDNLVIPKEDNKLANIGDYIIKDASGAFDVSEPDTFTNNYELIKE